MDENSLLGRKRLLTQTGKRGKIPITEYCADTGVPRCLGGMKREPGENPGRCRHCVRPLLCIPMGNREGYSGNGRSQETCLHSEEIDVCGSQNMFHFTPWVLFLWGSVLCV